MHLKRAADLCAQGWSLRQIGAELVVVPWTAVGRQLRPVGGAMAPASTSHNQVQHLTEVPRSVRQHDLQHPIVEGSGTGGFEAAKGRVDFKDIIGDPVTFVYRGHISLS